MKQNVMTLVIFGLLIFCVTLKVLALEKVTLQLRWDHQFQFAGYYAADWKGYYRDAGFEVDIKSALDESEGILNAVTEVAEGRADFGIGATDVLLARNNGIPLVILATIFQKSAAGFYFKKDTKLNSLADLTHLRVARRINSMIDLEFQAMLKSEGIKPSLIRPYPHRSGLDHLINDDVHVMPGYSIALPYAPTNQNIEFRTLSPWRFGIDFYGDSLFAHERLIDKDPAAIQRFKEATLSGWQYALHNPDEIVSRISTELTRRAIDVDLFQFNQFQVKGVKDLTLHPIVEIGHTNPDRWRKIQEHLHQLGIVKTNIDLSRFVFDPLQRKAASIKKIKTIVIFTVITALFLTALVLTWIMSLRKKVASRTAALSEEIKTRKQAETEMASSKEFYLNILENIDYGIWVTDAGDEMIYFNPGME